MAITIEDFCKGFDGLNSQISSLNKKINSRMKEIEQLKMSLETKRYIQEVLNGLKTTPNQKDPGKYDSAFYFVKEITSNNARTSNKPSLYEPCPQCKNSLPVLVKYEQTEDSPDGDTWEKDVFIMCEKDGVHKLAHFASDYRF